LEHYYLVSLLNSPLSPLTYKSEYELKIGNIVEITLNRREKLGIVLSKTKKPNFKCSKILSVKDEFYDETTLLLAKFISEYYVSSLGDALKLFIPSLKNPIYVTHHIKTDIILSNEQNRAFKFIQNHKKLTTFWRYGKWQDRDIYKMH